MRYSFQIKTTKAQSRKWAKDDEVMDCSNCTKNFTVTIRKVSIKMSSFEGKYSNSYRGVLEHGLDMVLLVKNEKLGIIHKPNNAAVV